MKVATVHRPSEAVGGEEATNNAHSHSVRAAAVAGGVTASASTIRPQLNVEPWHWHVLPSAGPEQQQHNIQTTTTVGENGGLYLPLLWLWWRR